MKREVLDRILRIVFVWWIVVLCMLISHFHGYIKGKKEIQKQAVDKGYAIYNPTNGAYQWK